MIELFLWYGCTKGPVFFPTGTTVTYSHNHKCLIWHNPNLNLCRTFVQAFFNEVAQEGVEWEYVTSVYTLNLGLFANKKNCFQYRVSETW